MRERSAASQPNKRLKTKLVVANSNRIHAVGGVGAELINADYWYMQDGRPLFTSTYHLCADKSTS